MEKDIPDSNMEYNENNPTPAERWHAGRRREKWGTVVVEGRVIGRNKIVVPPEEVENLAALGCQDKEIADFFGVDTNTLRFNFEAELVAGRSRIKQALRREQLRVALSGNPTMLIWLGKNILSQSESAINTDISEVLPFDDDIEDAVVNELDDDVDAAE